MVRNWDALLGERNENCSKVRCIPGRVSEQASHSTYVSAIDVALIQCMIERKV